jgi:glycosyltransferase involved in cell wall biosynthesis
MVAFTNYSVDSRVRREAEALAERGDRVDVISLRPPGDDARKQLNDVTIYQVRVPRYRGTSIISYAVQYAAFFLAASSLLSFLHVRRRYDVVQIHTMPDFMVFTAALPKRLGAKIILDVHDLMPELYESKFHLLDSHRLVRFLKWVEKRSISFADVALAVHEPHRDALVDHGNSRDHLKIVLNAPDQLFKERDHLPSRDDRFKLVYHGTISPRHGLDVAVRAAAIASPQIDGFQFLILGVGDDVPRIRHLVTELNLNRIVDIRGDTVPLDDLIQEIGDADAGVVPILNDSFTRYMLPQKLLDYVALGIPVICSDTETIRHYFDDSMAAFFTPGDEHELAERLLELSRKPILRRDLARNASSFFSENSWESQKLRYRAIVDSLASGRN